MYLDGKKDTTPVGINITELTTQHTLKITVLLSLTFFILGIMDISMCRVTMEDQWSANIMTHGKWLGCHPGEHQDVSLSTPRSTPASAPLLTGLTPQSLHEGRKVILGSCITVFDKLFVCLISLKCNC